MDPADARRLARNLALGRCTAVIDGEDLRSLYKAVGGRSFIFQEREWLIDRTDLMGDLHEVWIDEVTTPHTLEED